MTSPYIVAATAINVAAFAFLSDTSRPLTIMVILLNGCIGAAVIAAFLFRHSQRLLSKMAGLQQEVQTDPLTGAANRRWLQTVGQRLWVDSLERQRPFSVSVVDVDSFKPFNTRFGHLAGDQVLQVFAGLAKAQLRVTDHLVRLGGDEFLLVLPGADLEGAVKVTERLLAAAASREITVNGDQRERITISAGVASSAQQAWESLEHLIKGADKALYQTKALGGNCVCVWDPAPSPARSETLPPVDDAPARQDFHEALSRLLVATDEEAIVRELLSSAVQLSGATQGAVFQYDPTVQGLRFTVSFGVAPSLDERLRRRPPWRLGSGRGITGWVAATGEPLYVPDLLADKRWTGRSLDRRSGFWVPLVVGGELLGAFNVLSDQVDGLTEAARVFIVTMARYAAVVMERHRRRTLMEQTLEREKTLAVLAKQIQELSDPDAIVGVGMAQALAAAGMEAAVFFTTDPSGTSRLTRLIGEVPEAFRVRIQWDLFPPGVGAVGHVVQARSSLVLEDYAASPYAHPEYVAAGLRSTVLIPLLGNGAVIGVIGLHCFTRRAEAPPALVSWLEALAGRVGNAYRHNAQEQVVAQIRQTRESALEVIGRALELRDYETDGHTRRVTDLAMRLAQRLGFDGDRSVAVRWGALLHDIGKLAVPDTILLKQGPLDPDERLWMQRHTRLGADMLSHMVYLPQETLDIVRSHHERWDGGGYPDGLGGEKIPLVARLFSVVDVYDALVSPRPYKHAWSAADAERYIREQAGTQFDPEMVAHFLAVLSEVQAQPVREEAS